MRVFHLSRRRIFLGFLSLALVISLSFVLVGCLKKSPNEAPSGIFAATNEERISYLNSLGWEVTETEPIETLDLKLPEDLLTSWADYVALQDSQDLPFGGYAGQTVQRYTYRISNYPDVPNGVQANLYLCGDTVIGGDIIATGKQGFQAGLTFPKS